MTDTTPLGLIVVRLKVPVKNMPVGTELGYKDVPDAIAALGSAAFFDVVRDQQGNPIPPLTPEEIEEAQRAAQRRAKSRRLILGADFDPLWNRVDGIPSAVELEQMRQDVDAVADVPPRVEAVEMQVARVDPGEAGTVGRDLTIDANGNPAWYEPGRVSLLHPRFGVKGDGVTDDTAAIQAAIDSGVPLFIPEGTYRITSTLKTRKRSNIEGAGKGANIRADSVSGPVILTYPGTGNASEDEQYLAGFNISGTATCAMAFAHFINSMAERITLDGFTGQDGFVFEYLWSAIFRALRTNGATIRRAAFKVNKVCLDATFDLLYSSNFSDWSLYMDERVQEYSTGTGTGFGKLNFNTFTAQGANVAGLGLINLSGQVTFTNLYTENNYVAMVLGNGVVDSNHVQFTNCSFAGVRANAPFQIYMQRIGTTIFQNGRVNQALPIVFGRVASSISFMGVQRVGNLTIFDLFHRTGDTTSVMPVSIYGDVLTGSSSMTLKHSGLAWGFFEMKVDSTGAWVPTAKSPPLVDWKNITSLTASGTTVTAVSPAHGYTTGDTVTVANASPNAYNGTRTITVVDENTFTYTAASAPSASPAIGAPVVKK